MEASVDMAQTVGLRENNIGDKHNQIALWAQERQLYSTLIDATWCTGMYKDRHPVHRKRRQKWKKIIISAQLYSVGTQVGSYPTILPT